MSMGQSSSGRTSIAIKATGHASRPNPPIKRHGVVEWIKTRPVHVLCTADSLQIKRCRLKVKKWKKIFHESRNFKKARVAILISDKIDFKTMTVKRDKEGYNIMIKWSIREEDTTIINIYAPNIGAHKYIEHILMNIKRETNSDTIIVGGFNTLLTSLDRSSRQI